MIVKALPIASIVLSLVVTPAWPISLRSPHFLPVRDDARLQAAVEDARALFLAGQRFINKTYPTNSGEEPSGLEALARERHGRNSMHADGSARLMLALVSNEFGRPAADYLRSRLRRPLVSDNSSMGGGFPEGTLYDSKIGDAYDTLAEIVHAELPDGRRLIVAAYSNGRDPDGPDEQDLTALSGFSKLLLERLPPSNE